LPPNAYVIEVGDCLDNDENLTAKFADHEPS
jgi:hypothetical protein